MRMRDGYGYMKGRWKEGNGRSLKWTVNKLRHKEGEGKGGHKKARDI